MWTQGEFELFKWHDGFPQSRKTGLWEDFYGNGQLSRRYIYNHDIRYGGIATVIEQYDTVGNLLDSMTFVDGVGICKQFYHSGKIEGEDYYVSPNHLVYEKVYSETDGLSILLEYPTDSIMVKTCYFPNGKLKSIENFKAFMWWDFGAEDDYPVEYEKFGIQEYYSEDGELIRREDITERIMEE